MMDARNVLEAKLDNVKNISLVLKAINFKGVSSKQILLV